MSADLQWMLLRKNNKFVVKRDGAVFSAEPNNLVNKPSFKHCGLVNRKAVGVSANKDGQIVLKTKRGGRAVNKKWAAKVLKNSKYAKGKHQAAVAILAAAQSRPDLAHLAVARYHALAQAKKNASQ